MSRMQKKRDAQRNETKRRKREERERERAKRRNKRQHGSRGHKRRGTRANQIALICCASSKNVNARRPLVIQPCRAPATSLSFPRAHPLAFPSPFGARDPSVLCLVPFTRYTRWLLSAVLCSALRFSHADRLATRIHRPEGERET